MLSVSDAASGTAVVPELKAGALRTVRPANRQAATRHAASFGKTS